MLQVLVVASGGPLPGWMKASLPKVTTFVANNGDTGILVRTNGSGNVIAVFNRVEVVSNGEGISLDRNGTGVIAATAADSVASVNNDAGFSSNGLHGGGAVFLVVRSVAASNGTGIQAQGGAVLAIGQSAVFGNTRGWEDMGSGVLQSYGDNDFNANSNNSGSLTPVAKQ